MTRPRKSSELRRTVTLRVDPAVLANFDRVAEAKGLTRSEAVERAMRAVVKGAEQPQVAPRFK